jgi:hypothetical protein
MKRARNVVLREYIHQLRSAPPESKPSKARASEPPRKRVRTKRRVSGPRVPPPVPPTPQPKNLEPALPKADISITLKGEEVTSAGCAPPADGKKLPGAEGAGEGVGEGFHTRPPGSMPGLDAGVPGNADRDAGRQSVTGLKAEVGEMGDAAETELLQKAELPNPNPVMETKPNPLIRAKPENGQLTWITHWVDPQGHVAAQLSQRERTRLGEILGAGDTGGSAPSWGVGLQAKGCPPQDHESWLRGLQLACCGPESKPPVNDTVEGQVSKVVKEPCPRVPEQAGVGMGLPALQNRDVSWAPAGTENANPQTSSAAGISGPVPEDRPVKTEWGCEEPLPSFPLRAGAGQRVAGGLKRAASSPLGKRKTAEPGIESLLESLQMEQTEIPSSMASSLEALMSGGLSLGAEGGGDDPLGEMNRRSFKKRPAPIRVQLLPNVKTPSVTCPPPNSLAASPRRSAGFGSSASAPCLLGMKPSGSRTNLSPTRSLTQKPDRMNTLTLLESPSNLDLTAMVMEHISGLLDEQEEHLTRVDPACPEVTLEPGDVNKFLEQHTQMRAAVGFLTALTGGLTQGKPGGSAGSLENSVGSQDWPSSTPGESTRQGKAQQHSLQSSIPKEAAGESVEKEPGEYPHQAFSEAKGGPSSDQLHGDWNRSWEVALPSDAPRILTGENDQPWPGSEDPSMEWQSFSFQGQATELEPLATWRPAEMELGPKSCSTAGEPFLGPTTPIMPDWDQQF